MKGILLRWLILTVGVMVAAYLIRGITVTGFSSALLAAAILGILNAFFRPILLILTLPINILTLNLFTFVMEIIGSMLPWTIMIGMPRFAAVLSYPILTCFRIHWGR